MKLGKLFYPLCEDENDILFSGDYGIATNIGGNKFLFLYSYHLRTYKNSLMEHNGREIYSELFFSLVRDFLSHPTEQKAHHLELKYPSISYSIPRQEDCFAPLVLTRQTYEKAMEEMEHMVTNTVTSASLGSQKYTNYPKEQYALPYDTFCKRYSTISYRMKKIPFSSPFE